MFFYDFRFYFVVNKGFMKRRIMKTNRIKAISATLLCWILFSNVFLFAITEQQGWEMVPGILERIQAPVFPDKIFDITQYGAKGNGGRDCTQAFAKLSSAMNTEEKNCCLNATHRTLVGTFFS